MGLGASGGLRWTDPAFFELDRAQGALVLNDGYAFAGDSGGPVLVKLPSGYRLLAIHSTYDPNTSRTYSPLVAPRLDWIRAVAPEESPSFR